jgi:hypothetical protein
MCQFLIIAVVAAYLIYKNIVSTLVDAVHFLREKKKDAFFWSVNFHQPLEIWTSQQNLKT